MNLQPIVDDLDKMTRDGLLSWCLTRPHTYLSENNGVGCTLIVSWETDVHASNVQQQLVKKEVYSLFIGGVPADAQGTDLSSLVKTIRDQVRVFEEESLRLNAAVFFGYDKLEPTIG